MIAKESHEVHCWYCRLIMHSLQIRGQIAKGRGRRGHRGGMKGWKMRGRGLECRGRRAKVAA